MKTVLITGCSTGIGRHAATYLAEKGFKVYACARKESDLNELGGLHHNIEPIELDVNNKQHIKRAAEKIEHIDGLVNNAGIAVGGPLELVPDDRIQKVMDTNVVAQVAVTREFTPLLRRSSGRIVFIGSQSGYFTRPFVGAYSASKFAIEAIADAFRIELNPCGIKVALLQPGVIKTPIWNKSIAAVKQDFDLNDPKVGPYKKRLEKAESLVSKNNETGAETRLVSEAIFHSLTSSSPKIRYRIGRDAVFYFWLSRLPSFIKDWLIFRAIGK